MTPQQLREFMLDHDLLQSDMAFISGKTERAVQFWVAGTHPIPQSLSLLLRAIDDGLLTMDWIVAAIPN